NPGKGKNAGLTKFNSKIYYALKEGIFTLNTNTNQFEKDKTLSNVFDKNEYISGKMMVDQSNRLWLLQFGIGRLQNRVT
ncbi:MAG TPA: hypothetical protein PLB11_11550, partial [Flavobacterium sp.]|nr:hypothetical protein [Flavobacterium sp.]